VAVIKLEGIDDNAGDDEEEIIPPYFVNVACSDDGRSKPGKIKNGSGEPERGSTNIGTTESLERDMLKNNQNNAI